MGNEPRTLHIYADHIQRGIASMVAMGGTQGCFNAGSELAVTAHQTSVDSSVWSVALQRVNIDGSTHMIGHILAETPAAGADALLGEWGDTVKTSTL